LTDLANARQHLDRAATAQNASDRAAGYERLINGPPGSPGVKAWAGEVARVRRQCETLRTVSAPVAAQPAMNQLAEAVKALLMKADADPDGDPLLEVAGGDWAKLPSTTGQLRKAAEERYAALWGTLTGNPLPPLFALLAGAKGFPKKKLDRVRAIDSELALLPAVPPEKPDDLRAAQAVQRERVTLVGELEAAVPEQVRGLLARIAAGTATLADLQPAELGWIQNQGLAAGFAVHHAAATPPAPAAVPTPGRRQ
jgi:hypothetical protein